MRRWPAALIYEAAGLERQRAAESRLRELEDIGIASGLKLGQKYVDPNNPGNRVKSDEPHYTLTPLADHRAQLERIAYPWLHTAEALEARRELEEEAMFDQMRQAVAGLSA